MSIISYIRRSLTAQITLWVVGFAAVVLSAILLLIKHFLYPVISETDGGELLTTALLTAGASLVVLMLLCWRIIARHLQPLSLLAASAQQIADGNLEAELQTSELGIGKAVPLSVQKDEIGQLQNSFASMQHSLAAYMAEMQQKRDTLSRHNAELQAAYAHARESENVKTRFVSLMTEQMGQTVETINALTDRLCEHHAELSKTELVQIQVQMLSYTDTVTRLLDQMLNSSTSQSSPQ